MKIIGLRLNLPSGLLNIISSFPKIWSIFQTLSCISLGRFEHTGMSFFWWTYKWINATIHKYLENINQNLFLFSNNIRNIMFRCYVCFPFHCFLDQATKAFIYTFGVMVSILKCDWFGCLQHSSDIEVNSAKLVISSTSL